MSRFELTITASAGRRHVAFLTRYIRKAHHLLSPPLARLSLAIVGAPAMAALHQRYLNVAGPTDVLTFELDHDAAGHVTSGEVVICLDVARRQCAASGVSIQNELLLYSLHGLLHLCGFDDKTSRGFEAMHRKEDSLLTQLGIGPIFCPLRPRSSALPRPRARRPHSTGAR